VFRDVNERGVVSVMWKKAAIARAGLVSFFASSWEGKGGRREREGETRRSFADSVWTSALISTAAQRSDSRRNERQVPSRQDGSDRRIVPSREAVVAFPLPRGGVSLSSRLSFYLSLSLSLSLSPSHASTDVPIFISLGSLSAISNPRPYSILNPPTPGQILTGKDFGGSPTPPPGKKITKKAAAAKSKQPAPSKSKSSKKAAPAAVEEEEEVVQEGSSLDDIDNELAPSSHADADDDHEEEPIELSEKAKGKRSSRLLPAAEQEEEDDEEEEEDSDSDMIEINDEASFDSDEDDDMQGEEGVQEVEVERESGITEDDLVGSVSRDPGEEEGLSRRELTPLRRSVGKDRRLPESKRVKETGPPVPKAVVMFLEREVGEFDFHPSLLLFPSWALSEKRGGKD